MLDQALGTIEVLGLPAAIEAADVACKSADVHLIGYETTDGMGMVTVKIEGQVSAVKSAIDAARTSAGRVTKVFASSVIARPSRQLGSVVLTEVTVGLGAPASADQARVAPVVPPQPPEPAEPAEETGGDGPKEPVRPTQTEAEVTGAVAGAGRRAGRASQPSGK